MTVHKRKKKIIQVYAEYKNPIVAPIKKGDKVGELLIYVSNVLEKKVDIFSNENIKRANVFSRLFKTLNYLVWGDA